MANARLIVKRRKAVRNIRKITQTMQLIATARFQKCFRRAAASKPYTEKISEMIGALSGGDGAFEHPLLQTNDGATERILLIMTSNRGLCGSHNVGVLRAAREFQQASIAAGIKPELEVVGKKGLAFLKFLKEPVGERITDVDDQIDYVRVSEMAERYIEAYESGRVASVDVAYMRFVSVGQQVPTVARLLPIEPPETDEQQQGGTSASFEFSPPPEQLLANLIPETVKIRLYQFFNDAIVSEQVARMVAMKAATDAAGDMIKDLSRQYNRARQSQITLELADIVGGAAAVE